MYCLKKQQLSPCYSVSTIQYNIILDIGYERATLPEFLPTENHRSEGEPVQTLEPDCLLAQHWQRVHCLACKNIAHASQTIYSCCHPIFVKIL